MAPSLPGGAAGRTSKNSRLVILQGFPGFQETNKQSTRFSRGRITATDPHTENDDDNDDEDEDDDDDRGQYLLTTGVRLGAKIFAALTHLFFATTLRGRQYNCPMLQPRTIEVTCAHRHF